MMRLALVLSSLVVSLTSSLPLRSRRVEGGNVDYSLRNGPCVRMKVAQDNDDDGNSYFYNGAYRAQFDRYVSFFLCNDDDDCNSMYVTDMESYLEGMTGYIQNYCGACANQCRRRLEDEEGGEEEEEEEEYAADYDDLDCDKCTDDCSPYLNSNGGTDETEYLDCQAAFDDGDLAYYSAPQCDDGRISIGLYYDEDCSIKSQQEFENGFSYATFSTMEHISVDCSTGACDDLIGNAVDCNEDGGGDDYKLCKAAEKAGRTPTYYSKPWYKKINAKGIFIFLLAVVLTFGFLSYSYFVRHKQQPKIPLADLDHDIPEIS